MIPKYFAFLLALAATGPLSYAVPTTALTFISPDENTVVKAGETIQFVWDSGNPDPALPAQGDLGIGPEAQNGLPSPDYFYILQYNVQFGSGQQSLDIQIPTGTFFKAGIYQAGFKISGDNGFYMTQPFPLINPFLNGGILGLDEVVE